MILDFQMMSVNNEQDMAVKKLYKTVIKLYIPFLLEDEYSWLSGQDTQISQLNVA